MHNILIRWMTITFVVALVLVALMLCGCAKVDAPEDGHGKRFMTVYEDHDFEIVVDTETGVEYAVSCAPYNRGTFALLVDSCGNPYIYPSFDADRDALGEFPFNMSFCDGYEADEWVKNVPVIIPSNKEETE